MKFNARRAREYFFRACRLKCPECGTKPVFLPLLKVRSLRDYFAPLDGCPRCGYAYERETGYFLLSIWAINYGVGSLLGIALYFYLEFTRHLPLPTLLASVVLPVIAFNFLFARHSKTLFLALDHYFDPHIKDDSSGDGGSGKQNPPATPTPPAPQTSPTPPEPAALV
ncbi:MAG: DUF983 domain-containing protein [Verrucomicrobiota bacterium]